MIRNFLATNIWLKLTSLILATALWFFVISGGRSGIIIDAPIRFINVPPALEIVDAPKTVSIGIEGQERLLKDLKQDDISVVVEMGESKPGMSIVSLSEENIKLPRMFIITSISPQTISLTLEKQLKKDVSVKPVVVGLPAEGFVIENIKILPETVKIEGPRSVIRRTYTLKTEPIDISGIKKDMQYNVYLDIAMPDIKTDIQKVGIIIFVKKIR